MYKLLFSIWKKDRSLDVCQGQWDQVLIPVCPSVRHPGSWSSESSAQIEFSHRWPGYPTVTACWVCNPKKKKQLQVVCEVIHDAEWSRLISRLHENVVPSFRNSTGSCVQVRSDQQRKVILLHSNTELLSWGGRRTRLHLLMSLIWACTCAQEGWGRGSACSSQQRLMSEHNRNKEEPACTEAWRALKDADPNTKWVWIIQLHLAAAERRRKLRWWRGRGWSLHPSIYLTIHPSISHVATHTHTHTHTHRHTLIHHVYMLIILWNEKYFINPRREIQQIIYY